MVGLKGCGVFARYYGLGLKGYVVLQDESCCCCVHLLMCVTGLGIKEALCFLLEKMVV